MKTSNWKRLSSISIVLLLSACTTPPQKRLGDETVSLEMKTETRVQAKSLEIDKGAPENDSEAVDEIPKVATPNVSLTIYPSLYHSFGLIEVFKKIEKDQVKLSHISTSGFASLITALFVKKNSVSYLEWKLFDVAKRVKSHQPFSSKWNSTLNEFIDKEFAGLKIEDMNPQIWIPVIKEKKVVLQKQGLLAKALKDSLNIKSKANFLHAPKLYGPIFYESGVDINISFSLIPESMKFDSMDGYTYGVYTRYLGFLLKNPDRFPKTKTKRKLFLDQIRPLSEYTSSYQENGEELVKKIKGRVKEWQEENTTSSN